MANFLTTPLRIPGPRSARDDQVIVAINNDLYVGLESVSLVRAFDQMSRAFRITLTDRWTARTTGFPLAIGTPITISIGNAQFLDGYIEQTSIDLTAESKTVTIVGRDKSGDLIDCAIVGTTEFRHFTIVQIANSVLAPFHLTASAPGITLAAIDKAVANQGESPFSFLNRLAKKQGIVITTTPTGHVEFVTNAGVGSASAIIEGNNMLSASATFDQRDRFSDYILKGQKRTSDTYAGTTANHVRGIAVDASVTRYRPTIIVMDSDMDKSQAIRRAEWEAAARAAQSTNVQLTLVGWRDASGQLWDIGHTVPVQAPSLGLHDTFFVQRVEFLRDAQGTKTVLGLSVEQSYQPQPTITSNPGGQINQ